jgi:AraC-like DNA-binding protein
MLAWLLLTLSITLLNSVFFYSGFDLMYPGLFKIGLPISFLILPAAYIYVRSVLLGELKFRKYDWWMLVPAVLYTIILFPFYIMSAEEKRAIISEFLKDQSLRSQVGEGMLPPFIFSFFRIGWSTLFLILNFRIIARFKKKSTQQVIDNNRDLIRWIALLNWMLMGVLILALGVAIMAPFKKVDISIVDMAFGISATVICLQLFIRPKLLYGVFLPVSTVNNFSIATPSNESNSHLTFPEHKSTKSGGHNSSDYEINPELFITASDSFKYKKVVEGLFLMKKPFLMPDYTLDQLVADAAIPRYILSAFINREYGMGFREFLNRYRVDYFKDNLNDPEWKNLTLEAIAAECGFSSRSTFIKNFKQITGQTPSEYVKESQKPRGSIPA